MKHIIITILLGSICAFPLAAQAPSLFTFEAGGGFTTPVYRLGNSFDDGWNFLAGVGINPFTHLGSLGQHLGIMGEFQYNSLGINSTTLRGLGFPGGNMDVWSFTIDPILRLRPRARVDPYIIGGGGIYHAGAQYTVPMGSSFSLPGPSVGASNQFAAASSVYKPGWDAGLGFEARMGRRNAKLFLEARYQHMFTYPLVTSFITSTFGFRW